MILTRSIISGMLVIVLTTGAFPQDGPTVRIRTAIGDVTLLLDSVHAPNTVGNFMRYVDGGFFDGGTFFRTVTMHNQPNDSVKIEVIQGGIAEERKEGTFPPIRLETTRETGIGHRNGTISMARSSPHSATWSFFLCIGDQPDLDFGGARNPDGQGFGAFGQVIDGLNIVRSIQQSPARGQSLDPPVRIISISRANS